MIRFLKFFFDEILNNKVIFLFLIYYFIIIIKKTSNVLLSKTPVKISKIILSFIILWGKLSTKKLYTYVQLSNFLSYYYNLYNLNLHFYTRSLEYQGIIKALQESLLVSLNSMIFHHLYHYYCLRAKIIDIIS